MIPASTPCRSPSGRPSKNPARPACIRSASPCTMPQMAVASVSAAGSDAGSAMPRTSAMFSSRCS